MLLAEWRKAKGWTQRELALVLQVSTPSVASWEQRLKVPAAQHLVRIYCLSDGAVQPNDFYDLPDLSAPAAVAA